MKELKVVLPQQAWGTLNTKYPASSARVGADDFTSGSKNFELDTKGAIVKVAGHTEFNATALAVAPRDQYEAVFSDGVHYLIVIADGDVYYSTGSGALTKIETNYTATGNFEFAMYADRVYMNNGVVGKVFDRTASYGGVSYTPPQIRAAGCTIPASALTAADKGSGTGPGAATYAYKVTYLYHDGDESNGGSASTPLVMGTGNAIALTSIPVGGYGVTARKIYRTADGGATYRLVLTVSNNTATTADDTATVGTALIPTDNGVPPVSSLILAHADRVWFGKVSGDTSTLWYSAAGQPDIVYSTNWVTCNPRDPIRALVVFNGRVVVFNRNSFGQILGSTPDTFYYSEVPGAVGCIDCRTLQVRTIRSVPVLVWLSDKGFYAYNGATVDYISDPIENLVNFNLQQSAESKGYVSHSTKADFEAGTLDAGIDTVTSPGAVTTKGPLVGGVATGSTDPSVTTDTEAEWVAGATRTNAQILDVSNAFKAPTLNAFALASGTDNSTTRAGGYVTLPVASDWTGEAHAPAEYRSKQPVAFTHMSFATLFTVPRSGYVNSLKMYIGLDSPLTETWLSARIDMYAVDGSGDPTGSPIAGSSTPEVVTGSNGYIRATGLNGIAVGGVTYAMVARLSPQDTEAVTEVGSYPSNLSGGRTSYKESDSPTGGTWGSLTVDSGATTYLAAEYGYVQTAVATAGEWVSAVYDSHTDGLVNTGLVIDHFGDYPGGTTHCTTILEGSASASMASAVDLSHGDITSSQQFNGSGFDGKRYFRVRFQLSTSDDRNTPAVGAPTLKFTTTAAWVSPTYDHTVSITALNALTSAGTTPGGTTVTLEIATSATDSFGSPSWSAVGSATPRRYSRIRVSLAGDAGNTSTPTVTSVTLTYTVVASMVSSVIDHVAAPVGWDIFQDDHTANGGTVAMAMRSESSNPPTGAYTTVTSGAYPTLTPLRYSQWKVTLTSTAGHVPELRSATINWFQSLGSNSRAASLFVDRVYYCAAAELGQAANNVVLCLDSLGRWTIRRDMDAATMGQFFNIPYFGSNGSKKLMRMGYGTTANGTNIEFDCRLKADDFGDQTKRKGLHKIFVTGLNTGATMTVYYSTDAGTSWQSTVDSAGSATYATSTDGLPFTRRFSPVWPAEIQGQTLLVRVHSNDAYGVEIHNIIVHAYLRDGDIL